MRPLNRLVDGATSAPDSVRVANLRLRWATPTTLRWQWDVVAGSAAGFDRYELVLGPTVADVTTRSARSRVVTRDESPELGYFDRPDTSERMTEATITGLSPATDYAAVLVAYDPRGNASETSAATARTTPAPTRSVVLWDEPPDQGYSIPAELVPSTMDAASGATCLELPATCDAGQPRCFIQLRRQGLAIDASAAAAGLATAYLEVAVYYPGDRPSFYSQLRLALDPAAGGRLLAVERFAIPNRAAWQVIEIPLAQFGLAEPPLDATDLTHTVFEWTVGGTWLAGTVVRIDRVQIRW